MKITKKMLRNIIEEEVQKINELFDDEYEDLKPDDSGAKDQLRDALITLGKEVPRLNLTAEEIQQIAPMFKMIIDIAKAGNNDGKLERAREQLGRILGMKTDGE